METKHTPFALPVQIGMGEHGFNANFLADANGDAIAQMYGIPQNTSADELRQLAAERPEMWADGLTKAEFIMRACNAHEQLVAALKYAKMRLELADEDRFDKTTLQQINDALKAAGAA